MKKKKWILGILIGLAAIIGIFLIVVAAQPADYRISRSQTMTAPIGVVFPLVNDLHNWNSYSPWMKLDPNTKYTFDGSPAGTGAILTWAGNNDVGEGKMTITDSQADNLVRMKIEFAKPFEGTSNTEFAFVPAGNQTSVTWTMTGTRSFIEKAVCLVLNMDKMLGGQFEEGLAQMKAVAEKSATK